MTLDKRHIEAFYEQGYFVLPHFFSEVDCKRISGGIDRLIALSGREKFLDQKEFVFHFRRRKRFLTRVQWCGAFEPVLANAGRDPRLLRVVSEVFGAKDLVHIINQVHLKWPRDGVFYPLHQDSQHRRYGTELWVDVNGRGSYVQSVFAVSPVTKDNGALLFVPQSCKKGHLALPYKEGVQTRREDCGIEDAQILELSQGSVVFFGPYTIHGSLPNTSTSLQKLFINGYALSGANRREYLGCGVGRTISVR